MRKSPSSRNIRSNPSSRRTTRTTKSLVTNLGEFAEPLITIPPDGGWGWVVVTVSFIIMFIIDGVGYCFAIFFEDISQDLGCEVTEVALTASILGGFYYLAGPITCAAINRFGFRVIGLAGGLVGLFAFTGASFMNSILPFTVLLGCFGGTAFNLLYTPSIIATGFYFEKWRALAMAIVCCGSSLGVMCMPLIMTGLLGSLTWRNKFRILAVIFGLSGVTCLITLRPLTPVRVERVVQFDVSTLPSEVTIDEDEESSPGLIGGIVGFFQRFKNAIFPTVSETTLYESQFASRQQSGFDSVPGMVYTRDRNEPESASAYLRPDDEDSMYRLIPVQEEDYGIEDDVKEGCCTRCFRKVCCCFQCSRRRVNPTTVNRPMYRDDIFYTGSVKTLPHYSRPSSRTSRISRGGAAARRSTLYAVSITRAITQRDLAEETQCMCCPEAVMRVLATMLHFEMLKSPTFLLLLISGYLSLMGTYICYTYVASRALEVGINPQSAVLLLSFLGIANTFGRAMCGVASCFPSADINIISWIAIGICGISSILSVYLCRTYPSQIVFCCVFGFTIAAFAVLRAVQFVDFFGIENLTNCFGLNMIFQSLAAFSGIPMANFLYSATGTFAVPFLFTGVAITVSALLLIPLRCILRWEEKKKKKKQQQQQQQQRQPPRR